jgi:hypothetical protein
MGTFLLLRPREASWPPHQKRKQAEDKLATLLRKDYCTQPLRVPPPLPRGVLVGYIPEIVHRSPRTTSCRPLVTIMGPLGCSPHRARGMARSNFCWDDIHGSSGPVTLHCLQNEQDKVQCYYRCDPCHQTPDRACPVASPSEAAFFCSGQPHEHSFAYPNAGVLDPVQS